MRGGSIPNQTEQQSVDAEADLEGGDVDKAPVKGTDLAGSYVEESLEEETNLNKVGLFENLYNTIEGNNDVPTLFSAVDNLAVQNDGESNPVDTNTGEHKHCVCGESECSEHEKKTFATAISQDNEGKLTIGSESCKTDTDGKYILEGGTYYLSTDITPDTTIRITGDVNICLNGKNITKQAGYEVIRVDSGSLTLTDCKGGTSNYGKITHGKYTDTDNSLKQYSGEGVTIYNGRTFNMYGGQINGNSDLSGGGVYIASGAFNMYGGSISGNNAGYGGGVYVNSNGTFTMSGGSISGNNAGHDGGGVVVYGTFNMSGGSISGNNAGYGGGVYAAGTFNMYGGSISGNNAGYGGGVYVYYGTFTVSGEVQITDNVKGGTIYNGTLTGGTANNVYLPTDKTITIGGALGTNAKIGVTTYSVPTSDESVKIASVQGESEIGETTINALCPDAGKDQYDFKLNEGNPEILMVAKPHKHYLCGGSDCNKVGHSEETSETEFTAWTSNSSLPSTNGNYYLTEDVTLSATWDLRDSVKNIVLCLNGHTITMTGKGDVINVWNNSRSLTLTDCSESKTGKVTHEKDTTGRGVEVSTGSTFTLYGGSITGNETASGYGGGGVLVYGTFNMCGGSISGNNAGSNGGGVYVSGGTFNMKGDSSICGNNATGNGGGVYVASNSSFTMSGGTITDNTATGGSSNNNGGGVYLGKSCNFTMEGDSIISGNSAQCGGGVCVFGDASTFTMTGGSISNNNASNTEYGSGGGVYMGYGTFTMNGGSITGNNATGNGGGVFVNSSFTVSGATNITGNVKDGTKDTDGNYTGGNKNNVYLPKFKTNTITITIGNGGLTAGDNDGAKIGVTTGSTPTKEAPVTIATGATGEVDYTKIFTSDVTDKGYAITRQDDGNVWNLYLSAHQHEWTYAAENNTITATCKGCVANNNIDYSGGTVTINAPTGNLTYNGSVQEATVDTTTGNWKGGSVGDITYEVKNNENKWVSLTGKPKDAGTYRAKITMAGNDDKSVTAISDEYTIAKANPQASDFTFTALTDLIYDGKDKTAEVKANAGINGMGGVTVKYYKKYTGNYYEEISNAIAVKNAGTYLVKIDVEEGDNYKAATGLTADNWTFTIAKADYTGESISIDKSVLWTHAYQSEVVDMTGYLPDIDGAELSTAKVYTDVDNIIEKVAAKRNTKTVDIDMNGNVAVGKTATIKVTITSTNYKDIIAIINVSTRGKDEATVEISGLPDTVTYGQEFTLTSTAKEGGTTLIGGTWSWDYSSDYFKLVESYANTDIIKLQAIKAGSVGINVSYSSSTHIGSEYKLVEIQRKTLTKNDLEDIPTSLTKVYDGGIEYTYPTGTSIALALNKNVQVTESDRNMQIGISANQITFAQSDVGTTTATIILNALPSEWNYIFAEDFTEISGINATITQRPIRIASATAVNRDYVKGNKNVDVNVDFDNLPDDVTLTKGIDYTVTGTMTDDKAGTDKNVDVTVNLINKNYLLETNTKTATVNINKVAFTGINVASGKAMYGKSGTVDLSSMLAEGGTFGTITTQDTDSVLSGDVTISDNKLNFTFNDTKDNADKTATVTIPVTSTNYINYSITVTLTVLDKLEQSGFNFAEAAKTVTYGDADFTIGATGAVTGSNVTYSSSDEKVATVDANTGKVKILKVGTTTITATASATNDYNEATANYTLTVNPKELIIKANNKTAYVGENPPVLGKDYTVSGLVGDDELTTEPTLNYVDASGSTITPDMTKAGDTIIRASGASAGDNYIISHVDGTLTVSNKPSGGHTKNTDVITTGDKDKTTTSPAEVKTDGAGTATAAVSKANQEEILKQAKDNKSSDIVLNISDKDTKGADNIQLELPKSMIDAIANDTAADLTINTENGKLTVDKDTLDQLSKDAKGSTLRIIITKIKEPTAEQQKLAGDNVQPYRLTIMSGNQTIGSFAGKITVRLPIPEMLKDKTVAAVHFDSDGKLTEMPGKRMMIDGIEYYVFETTHFSEFGLVDAVEAGLVKTDDSKDKVKEAKSIVSKMNLTAVTSKTTKKNVKVTVTMNKKTSSDIKALKELGYTVKYRFYRSTKKSAGYKSKITKKTNTYINTAGKKGTRYYYKAQVRVYDSKGKLITTTALKQCSYGTRTWSK